MSSTGGIGFTWSHFVICIDVNESILTARAYKWKFIFILNYLLNLCEVLLHNLILFYSFLFIIFFLTLMRLDKWILYHPSCHWNYFLINFYWLKLSNYNILLIDMSANFITCIFSCDTSLSFDVKDLLLHMTLFTWLIYYLFAYDIWSLPTISVLLHSDDNNMILLLFVHYILNLEDSVYVLYFIVDIKPLLSISRLQCGEGPI